MKTKLRIEFKLIDDKDNLLKKTRIQTILDKAFDENEIKELTEETLLKFLDEKETLEMGGIKPSSIIKEDNI